MIRKGLQRIINLQQKRFFNPYGQIPKFYITDPEKQPRGFEKFKRRSDLKQTNKQSSQKEEIPPQQHQKKDTIPPDQQKVHQQIQQDEPKQEDLKQNSTKGFERYQRTTNRRTSQQRKNLNNDTKAPENNQQTINQTPQQPQQPEEKVESKQEEQKNQNTEQQIPPQQDHKEKEEDKSPPPKQKQKKQKKSTFLEFENQNQKNNNYRNFIIGGLFFGTISTIITINYFENQITKVNYSDFVRNYLKANKVRGISIIRQIEDQQYKTNAQVQLINGYYQFFNKLQLKRTHSGRSQQFRSFSK